MRDLAMNLNWTPPTLSTPRLTLRPVTLADVDSIFAYASNSNMTRYTLWETHSSTRDTVSFIEEYARGRYLEKMPDPMAICRTEDPTWVIGTIGCFWNKQSNRTMELGYALSEEFWGQGIVVEAARALLDYVFAAFEVERVQAHCFVENQASARVLEKLGMTLEGCHRSALFHRNRSWDLLMFSVLRSEWPGVG